MLGDKVHNWQKIILLNTVAASFSAQNHKGVMECEVSLKLTETNSLLQGSLLCSGTYK